MRRVLRRLLGGGRDEAPALEILLLRHLSGLDGLRDYPSSLVSCASTAAAATSDMPCHEIFVIGLCAPKEMRGQRIDALKRYGRLVRDGSGQSLPSFLLLGSTCEALDSSDPL